MKNRSIYILALLACILATWGPTAGAQEPAYAWHDFVEEVSDDEYAEQDGWAEVMEELALLAARPMDVNTATREQLRQLPFLTDEQIEDIHTYIFLHRGMRSLGELLAIGSIDARTRRYLSLFLRADGAVFEWPDTVSLSRILRRAKHEVSTRMDIPLYYRLGYSYAPRDGGYRGSTLYNNVRYQMEERKHLSLGLAAEKDQGEPFRRNGGWDHYGAHLMVRNLGHLKAAVVGDYKMGFGEGLVVNTGFTTGKNSAMSRPSQGIRAKRSMDEVNYFRGAAATVDMGSMSLSAWLSHRRLDAARGEDGTVMTLQTSGLHRTTAELDEKRQVGSTMAGANLSWKRQLFHVGATGYYQHFQHPLDPGTAVYRRIYPQGRHFGIVGLNYGYTHPWFSLTGETAYSTERGGWATLERLRWKVSNGYTLSASYRFYSYRYYSFYGSALSENSRVQNESGATLRLDAKPADRLTLTAYADFFYNPWPRYTLTHSSRGQEATVTAEYQPTGNDRLAVRYQLKRKERNDQMELHNRLRLDYTRRQGPWWQLQSTLQLHALDRSGRGWSASQRIRFRKGPGRLSALVSYFHTPDYQTRLFQYEPLLTNMFRYPSLYGHGVRFVAAGLFALWQGRLRLEMLYGLTRYFDRQTQSSGMEEIRSPWKQDISVQLRLKI